MNKQKYSFLLAIVLVVATFVAVAPIYAQTNQQPGREMGKGLQKQTSNAMGTVLSNDGSVLTVSGRLDPNSKSKTAVTFTVKTSSDTKVIKANNTIKVSDIGANDLIVVQGPVSGTTVNATEIREIALRQGGMAITGLVVSNNGTSFIVKSNEKNNSTSQNYTVTVSASTTINKNGTKASLSDITSGDMVMVQGVISGTNITANMIRDGKIPQPQGGIQGNGQPVVAGSVTSNDGTGTIVIANKSNISYTVTIPSTTSFFVSGVKGAKISDVAVGDNIIVQGTVNGNSVTATSVIDQKKAGEKSNDNNQNSDNGQKTKTGFFGGMMNGIGGFFKHMFGF